jgi:hypothetical protein
MCVPGSQILMQSETVSDAGFLPVLVGPPAPPVPGLGTRPLPAAAGSCGFAPTVPSLLVPLWLDGVVVLVLVPESGMDPPGLGAKREGGKTSAFDRFGVIGPVGVEPNAGEPPGDPGVVARPVAPELDPAAPLPVLEPPELDPPEPDDWATAEPTERTNASAATRCLSRCFIEA